MTANPWSKFFWNDWENDPALRLCTLAAQGLWMRMLCLAAKADPVGHVKIAGQSCTAATLSRLTGEPEETIAALLAELERMQVFSRTRTGTIYNRRMVDDEKRRKTNRENGQKGGQASVEKQRGIFGSPKRLDEQPDERPPEPHKPEAISQEPDKQAARNALAATVGRRCLEILGNPVLQTGIVWQWLADGADPERDIYPAVQRGAGRSVRSLSYFTPAIAEAIKRRKADERQEGTTDLQRQLREKHFAETGEWLPGWGQRPTREVA